MENKITIPEPRIAIVPREDNATVCEPRSYTSYCTVLNDDARNSKQGLSRARILRVRGGEDNREVADRNFAPRFAKRAQRCLAKLQDRVKTRRLPKTLRRRAEWYDYSASADGPTSVRWTLEVVREYHFRIMKRSTSCWVRHPRSSFSFLSPLSFAAASSPQSGFARLRMKIKRMRIFEKKLRKRAQNTRYLYLRREWMFPCNISILFYTEHVSIIIVYIEYLLYL